jgi:hypothetical protein
MRTGLRIIAALLGGLAVLSGVAPSASAGPTTTTPVPTFNISLNTTRGPTGTQFVITWSASRSCKLVSFYWDGEQSLGLPTGGTGGNYVTYVPSGASLGVHQVTGYCSSLERTSNPVRFTVTPPPTTTTTTTTTSPPVTPPVTPPVIPPGNPPGQPPVITPPIRNPPSTTTRRRPPVTTTTPPGTSVPPPPISTTELPPLSTADPRPAADGDLILDKPAISVGETLSASGKGCKPGAPVTLMSKGERVGGTVADQNGDFTATIAFQRIEAGRHWVTTDCGVKLTAAVDQIVTSSTGGQSSTMIILVFFVLAGIALIRFR